MEHYMCYRVISSKTGGERIIDTVQFFTHDVPMLGSSATYISIEVAAELTDDIRNFKHVFPLKDMVTNGSSRVFLSGTDILYENL